LEEDWMTFSGLHGTIFQKIDLFITTSVKTSNVTKKERFCNPVGSVKSLVLQVYQGDPNVRITFGFLGMGQ
jgi:hypothetical protein